MKKPAILLRSVHLCQRGAALTPTTTQANTWRIDNNGDLPGNFTTLQAAFNAGSGGGHQRHAVRERLKYELRRRHGGQAGVHFRAGLLPGSEPGDAGLAHLATAGTITFSAAANGSLFTGISFGHLDIDADNILIKRNYGSYGNNCGPSHRRPAGGPLGHRARSSGQLLAHVAQLRLHRAQRAH